jgi:hypothetical protein
VQQPQVVNHGFGSDVSGGMLDVARRFFELPLPERARHMSADVRAPVRYGTSFNQAKDAVLCWRDFLKLVCQPLREVAPYWPQQPADLRDVATRYATASHALFMEVMAAALEALGIPQQTAGGGGVLGELAAASSHMMTVNCYPRARSRSSRWGCRRTRTTASSPSSCKTTWRGSRSCTTAAGSPSTPSRDPSSSTSATT